MKRNFVAVLLGVSLLAGGVFLANSNILPPASSNATAPAGSLSSVATNSATILAVEETIRAVELSVENMWCASCGYIVRQALLETPGVLEAEVSMFSQSAVVTYDAAQTTPDALAAAVSEYGYPSRAVANMAPPSESERFVRRILGAKTE